jgi:hypothetical protein
MPDVSTEVAIATTTLGSANSTITFSGISGSYTDLRLVLTFKPSSNGLQSQLTFNSDTASNYSQTRLWGDGSSASTGRRTNVTSILAEIYGGNTTNPHLTTFDIFSYAGSTFKTCLTNASEDDNGSGGTVSGVGLWRSTSAITTITLSCSNFATGTTATLYGIL